MNSLSTFIWLASAVERISVTCALTAIGLVFAWVFIGMNSRSADNTHYHSVLFEGWRENKVTQKWLPILSSVLILIAMLIPSERAMYMIAASEMGEQVAMMPETQEILDDLQLLLKQQIQTN